MFKKSIDTDGLSDKTLRVLEETDINQKISSLGIAGDKLIEPLPSFISTPSERVFKNDNGSYIILGRDRNASRLSGYGGKGDTQAASMDLVVGRLGSFAKGSGGTQYVDPNFELDSARIYISQKCDIDDYFNLPVGKYGNSKVSSGIGMKADKVVMASRTSLKLVAGLDSFTSQGLQKREKYGIELIANANDSDLQPIPKGKNLLNVLGELLEHIDELNGVIETLYRNQIALNTLIMTHTHLSSVPGAPTAPSIELIAGGIGPMIDIQASGYNSLIANKVNSTIIKYNYLSPSSKLYINSRYNYSN